MPSNTWAEVDQPPLSERIKLVVSQFAGALPASAISKFFASVESHPIPLHSESDRRKGGQFGSRLKKLQPYGYRLACGSVGRQAFLWGVANYLKGLPHEELVVGFGVAEGTRTCISSVLKIRGEADRVAIPPDKNAMIHDFLNQDERHTAIVVHNHPDGHPVLLLLGLVFGKEPLPSLADRNCGLDALLKRLESRMTGFAFGRILFYLVQNDRISEFSGLTPALALDMLRLHLEPSGAQG